MNLFTGEVSQALFGESHLQASVRRLIDEAALAPPEQREALLWTAAACAPECLAIYYLMYKFYASRRDFAAAQAAAQRGLARAAEQAGLAGDWRSVQPGDADFSKPGAARFWLFTLKAMAFIGLRAGHAGESREILLRLRALDPADSVGSGVIETLIRSTGGAQR